MNLSKESTSTANKSSYFKLWEAMWFSGYDSEHCSQTAQVDKMIPTLTVRVILTKIA